MQLNLTPEQEKLAKKALSKDTQTAEELFMSSVYLVLSKEKQDDYTEFPELVKPKTEPLIMKSNGKGGFIFPDNTPEHVRELLKHAE